MTTFMVTVFSDEVEHVINVTVNCSINSGKELIMQLIIKELDAMFGMRHYKILSVV